MRAVSYFIFGSGLVALLLLATRKARAATAAPGAGPFPEFNSVTETNMPRGIRNNNPGNIREGELDRTQWLGERDTDDDAAFEEFRSAEDGIRAMAVIIKNWRRLYGIFTLADIITRWAPPSENDTQAYIASVARRSGLVPFQIITDAELPRLIEAMILHENGVQPYTFAQIEDGVSRA